MQLIQESDKAYHSTAALTAHKLADFEQSPRLHHLRHVTGEWPRMSSPGFALGSLVHLLLLEPERRNELRTDAPVNPKTGRPYGPDTDKTAVWRAECEDSGQIAVTSDDMDTAQTMVGHALEVSKLCGIPLNPEGPTDGAVAENTCRGTDATVGTVQCRPDLWHVKSLTIWDVKTTKNFDGFKWDMHTYRYPLAAAWYLRLMRQLPGLSGMPIPFANWKWLVLEAVVPYRVAVYTAPVLIQKKHDQIDSLLERYAKCQETNVWPLNLTGYEFSLDRELTAMGAV